MRTGMRVKAIINGVATICTFVSCVGGKFRVRHDQEYLLVDSIEDVEDWELEYRREERNGGDGS